LGDAKSARAFWEKALSLTQNQRFEPAYNYALMRLRYYQAYCLRGLGRKQEAAVYIRNIGDVAKHSGWPPETKNMLRRLQALGEEEDFRQYRKFDTELGVTAFKSMATSVED
jgi:hypothetical protein